MSGRQINRADWTKERISAFKRFLNGDKDITYHGKKKNGEPYKKALRIAALIDYYKPLTFSTRKGALFVNGGSFGSLEVLTDEQVKSKARALYAHKETGLGKAPSIYNYMKTKFANVSYKKVEGAIKALPAYQKYQARHVAKPKARKVIIPTGPGHSLDTDVMKFSTEYYGPRQNEGFDALCVVVDRFSGYIGISPLLRGAKKKTAEIVGDKTQDIITSAAFPSHRPGTIFSDNGVEYREIFPDKMKEIGYEHVVISKVAGAPSAHAERAVGIIRGLVNNKLTSGGAKPRKDGRGRWWPLARTLVTEYNKNPMTDARAPYSPNQLKKFTGAKRAAIIRAMRAKGAKRVEGMKHRKDADGNMVSKVLAILKVGDRVRFAVEHMRKTGADKRPYPKQRWSDSTHTVTRVIRRAVGFAMYQLSGRARKRYEREDLQKI